jgi:protease-4
MLKRNGLLVILVLALAVGGVTSNAVAGTDPVIPSYYSNLQYNLTAPSAYATAVGGFANPGVYRMLPGSEVLFTWTDTGNRFRTMKQWGLFLGSQHAGLGVVRSRMPLPGGGEARVNDIRLAISGGTRNLSLGLGYGWSGGDGDLVGRSNVFQAGMVQRIGRYLSIGAAGTFAIENSFQTGIFDIAVRPTGDRLLTLFADAELPKGIRVEDAPWSVGAMVEAIPGVQLTGRYFENESYALSLAFGFGEGKIAASPRFDKDNNVTNTVYQIRSGYHDWNVFDKFVRKDKSYLAMNLKGRVRYRGYRYFDEETHRLINVLGDLDDAKNDSRIKGVALNLSGAKMSTGKAWEIRKKLEELQDAGKHVVIFLDGGGMKEYYLASVADRVVLDPEAMLYLPGYRMGRTFIKETLEKLGLGFDEWRFFEYKSAMEALSRDSMSEADRKQRFALIEDRYRMVRRDIADNRGIAPAAFDEWIDDIVVFNARRAKELGLVDVLGRWEDVKDVIKEIEGSGKSYMNARGIGRERYPSRLWGEDPRIAVVYALGICAMDSGIKARKLEKIFHRLRDDRSVRGVVFRVDSPGGDGMASDVVAVALRECAERKPVIVSQGDVAASGGYWISMYGTEIMALPTTITASIGVIGGWVWNKGIGDKLGLKSDMVKIGKHADVGFGVRLPFTPIMIPDRNLTPEERDIVKDEMIGGYNLFVDKVASGRKMTSEAVHGIAQGRVFSGVDGADVGLVDRIGGLDEAILSAKMAAGLDPDDEVTIMEYPPSPLFNLDFLKPSFLPFRVPVLARWIGPAAAPPASPEDDMEWAYIRALIGSAGRPLYMLPPGYYDGDSQLDWE